MKHALESRLSRLECGLKPEALRIVADRNLAIREIDEISRTRSGVVYVVGRKMSCDEWDSEYCKPETHQ